METNVDVERRKMERFSVPEGLFACVSADLNRIGAVLDISQEGLAFKYLAPQDADIPPPDTVHLEIFHRNSGLHIKALPFKATSDVEMNGMSSLGSHSLRRIGGRFGRIPPLVRKKLEQFVHDFKV